MEEGKKDTLTMEPVLVFWIVDRWLVAPTPSVGQYGANLRSPCTSVSLFDRCLWLTCLRLVLFAVIVRTVQCGWCDGILSHICAEIRESSRVILSLTVMDLLKACDDHIILWHVVFLVDLGAARRSIFICCNTPVSCPDSDRDF